MKIIHLRTHLKLTQRIFFFDNNLFDNFDQNDKEEIKMEHDDILKDENLNQNDVLFEELPSCPLKQQIIRPNKKIELTANKIKKKNFNQRKKKFKYHKMVKKSRVS